MLKARGRSADGGGESRIVERGLVCHRLVHEDDRDEHHGASDAGGDEPDDAKRRSVSHGTSPCPWPKSVADNCYQNSSTLISWRKQSVTVLPVQQREQWRNMVQKACVAEALRQAARRCP